MNTGIPDSAPADDLSPTLNMDTPGQGPDSGSGATDEVATLRAQLEDLNKRHSGQTLSWQQERSAREAAERELQYLKDNGVDLEEIKRVIAAAKGDKGAVATPNAPSAPPVPNNVMTRDEYALAEYNREKENLFEKKPEYDNEEFRDLLDARVAKIYREAILDQQRSGVPIPSPRQMIKQAEKALHSLASKIGKAKEKELTETRTAVKSQAVTESKHVKTPVDRSGGEDEQPETNEQYAERRYKEEARRRGEI